MGSAVISEAARALVRDADFLDLHVDAFIAHRLFGYDLDRRHDGPPLGGRFFGHLDFPRAVEAGLTGAMWSITTNPLRTRGGRWRAFLGNVARMRSIVGATHGRVRLVRTASEYDAARAAGAHACLLAVQGGNALSPDEGYASSIPDDVVTRVTLVHLTHSLYGKSATPYPTSTRGLTEHGRALVASLDERRVFVDLAHAHPTTFWDAVETHDSSLPLIVTHTGVNGVRRSWRNLDDEQLLAVADTGGVVGVIFEPMFLARDGGPRDCEMIVEHLAHIVKVAGADVPAIGTDYDGAITPPPDVADGAHLPLLVDRMLARGFDEGLVRKIMGENFLRTFRALRP